MASARLLGDTHCNIWLPVIFLTVPIDDDDKKQRCPKVASAHVLGDTRLQAVDTSLAYISLRPASSEFLWSSFIVMVDDFHFQLNREFSLAMDVCIHIYFVFDKCHTSLDYHDDIIS